MPSLPYNHAYCNTPPGLFLSVNSFMAYLARCKRWTCPPCAKARSRDMARRLQNQRFNWLLTFTAKPGRGYVSRETLGEFNKGWRRICQYLKRPHPKKTHVRADGTRWKHGPWSARIGAYVWSNERGDLTGHLHKHCVARISHWFCFACLREHLARVGLGSVCDFKRVSFGKRHAVQYVVKYVTKGGGKWRFPRYSRRVQSSALIQINNESSGQYHFVKRQSIDEKRHTLEVLVPSGIKLDPMQFLADVRVRSGVSEHERGQDSS